MSKVRRWYVAETKYQHESVASLRLSEQGFAVIVPTLIHKDQLRVLFPNYLFVRFSIGEDRWQSINGTRGVKTLLGAPLPLPLPHGVAERFSAPVDISSFKKIVAGMKVRILRGIYEGHITRVERVADRVMLLITMLGMSTLLPVDEADVEPV